MKNPESKSKLLASTNPKGSAELRSKESFSIPVGLEMKCSNDTASARKQLLGHLTRVANKRGNKLAKVKFRKTRTLLIVSALEVPPNEKLSHEAGIKTYE